MSNFVGNHAEEIVGASAYAVAVVKIEIGGRAKSNRAID
jgi:hypothetical protein